MVLLKGTHTAFIKGSTFGRKAVKTFLITKFNFRPKLFYGIYIKQFVSKVTIDAAEVICGLQVGDFIVRRRPSRSLANSGRLGHF